MSDYMAECPHKVSSIIGERHCGCTDFEVFEKGAWALGAGYDPSASLVKCKKCGGKYYLFSELQLVQVKGG